MAVIGSGVPSWRSAEQAQVGELPTVLTLIANPVEAHFVQGEAGLELLAQDVVAGTGLADLAHAQQLLDRDRRTQPEVAAIKLLALDGQFLATSSTPRLTGLPSLDGEPRWLLTRADPEFDEPGRVLQLLPGADRRGTGRGAACRDRRARRDAGGRARADRPRALHRRWRGQPAADAGLLHLLPGMDGPAVLRADPAGFDGHVTKPIPVASRTPSRSRALGQPA